MNPLSSQIYQTEDKSIVYNVLHRGPGWQIQAFLPDHLSPVDRTKVLDWFHDYRSALLQQHPFWLTAFNFTDRAYLLDIYPASEPKEMIANAVQKVSEWRQLDLFDYVQ